MKIGIGKCSCLKPTDFSIGDRVKIVHILDHWNHVKLGATGTVSRAIRWDGLIEVVMDGTENSRGYPYYEILLPQRLVKI